MIFKGANGTFGGIHTIFLRRDSLVVDVVLEKGILEIFGALIV